MSVGGFGFHAVASRLLGVAGYGGLYALISLYTIAAIPATLLAPVLVKYSAEFRALHDEGHLRGLVTLIVRVCAVVGVAYVACGVIFAMPIAGFLRVYPWEIPLVGLMGAVAFVSGSLRAVGQGIQHYAAFAASLGCEGIAKIVALLLFAIGGLTIFRGTAAFFVGMVIGLAFIALPLLMRFRGIVSLPIVLDWKRILATMAGAASLTLTMAVIGFADVVLVKHFFNATDAGLYAAASLCAKILLYFVGFVPAILIPHATDRHARGKRTRHTLLTALAFIVLVSFVGVVAYKFLGVILLHALVGRAFDAALPLLPGYAAAMALLAVTNALASYGIATHRLGFSLPLFIATLATLAAMIASHPSPAFVLGELLAGNVAILLCVAIPVAVQGLRQVRS